MILNGEHTSGLYGEEYYRAGCGPVPYERSEHWLNFFSLIADEIIRSLHPRRVLDAGCAKGFLVEALWDRGVYCEGIDISEYAISEVRADIREYCSVGSIATRSFDKFDVVTCIEVLEHLPPELAKPAIGNLCTAADVVLFSSTPSDFKEPTHQNVRPPIYWLQLFAECGFSPDSRFDAGFIAPHAILFRRGSPPQDDFLRLFSEHIRYKMALQAEQHTATQLKAKTADLSELVAGAQRELHDLRMEHESAKTQKALNSDLRNELGRAQSWTASLQREITGLNKARQELVLRLQANDTEIQTLRQKLAGDTEALERRLAGLAAERDHLVVEIGNRERDRLAVQATLDAILSSRAFRLAERLRRPVLKLRHDWPQLYRVVRFAARKLLGANRPSQTTAVQSVPKSDDAASTEADPNPSIEVTQRNTPCESGSQPFKARVDSAYQRWIDEHEPRSEDLEHQRQLAQGLSHRPVFSIIIPVYVVEPIYLRDCINSVLKQTYENWELCIAHAPAGDSTNLDYLRDIARQDTRVRLLELDENKGISGNSNAAIDLATGEFLAFLDHDDTLAPFALFEMALRVQQWPDLDLLYSDHDYLDAERGLRCDPLFKPEWSPEIMLSANYVTHFTAIRRVLVEELGRLDPATDGAQDWDLFLRATERTHRIFHTSNVLYHWRMHPESTARNASAKSYVTKAQLLTLDRHLQTIGLEASAEVMPDGLLHIRFHRPPSSTISIIIPTKDHVDLLSRCISSLLDITDYPSFEILIVDNASRETETEKYLAALQSDERIQVIWFPGSFNYSAVNNVAARRARGELLLFLNNDVEITRPDWLTELACWASYSPIGVVGGKLLRSSGLIQHAGVVLGMSGFADHPFADQAALTYGIAGSTGWYRNFLAVTGACMMMRREVFDQLGGFDEQFVLCGSDVEFCLRAWEHGYRVVYNPFAELVHHEQQTRGCDVPAVDYAQSMKYYGRWLLVGDPFWNPNLSLWSKKPAFRYRDEPSSLQFATRHVQAVCPQNEESASSTRAASEEESVVSWFDCSNEDFVFLHHHAEHVSGFRAVKRILWFIPAFENPFYGGIFTILRFAEYWRTQKGTESLFAICASTERDKAAERIRLVYPTVQNSDVYILASREDAAALPAVDASICTLWITAYYAIYHKNVNRRFYLIQDYEPAFYKAGSGSAVVESTYRMGLYGIANTVSLKSMYEKEYGGKAMHFTPCIDEKIFYPSKFRSHRRAQGPWMVFFYGRPGHPRNSFELLSAAMKQLKDRLQERVHIVSAGSEWNPADYDLQGIVENLGTLAYQDSARLYREADVGVVMMLTRHPSYIPMELMASGCLVVTNTNSWTSWLLKDGENCLLTYATATSIAETVCRGLLDTNLREQITGRALNLIRTRYTDWPPEMERVYEYLCDPEAYLEGKQLDNRRAASDRLPAVLS